MAGLVSEQRHHQHALWHAVANSRQRAHLVVRGESFHKSHWSSASSTCQHSIAYEWFSGEHQRQQSSFALRSFAPCDYCAYLGRPNHAAARFVIVPVLPTTQNYVALSSHVRPRLTRIPTLRCAQFRRAHAIPASGLPACDWSTVQHEQIVSGVLMRRCDWPVIAAIMHYITPEPTQLAPPPLPACYSAP